MSDGLLKFLDKPAGQGLLAAIAGGMATARRGQPWNTMGRAGMAGLMGMAGAQDRIIAEKAAAEAKLMRDLQMEQLKDAGEERKRQKGFLELYNAGMQKFVTPGSPAVAGTPAIDPTYGLDESGLQSPMAGAQGMFPSRTFPMDSRRQFMVDPGAPAGKSTPAIPSSIDMRGMLNSAFAINPQFGMSQAAAYKALLQNQNPGDVLTDPFGNVVSSVPAKAEKPQFQEIGLPGKPDWKTQALVGSDGSLTPVGTPWLARSGLGGDGIGGNPYFTPVPTPEGIVSFDNRRGTGVPLLISGKPAIRSADSPTLQGSLSAAVKESAVLGEKRGNISGAQAGLDGVVIAKQMLKEGIYTGGYGPLKNLGAKYTPFVGVEKVARTERFIAAVGESIVPRLKEFGGNDSNEELRYLTKISGGNIAFEQATLEAIIASSELKIKRGIDYLRSGRTVNGDIIAAKAVEPTPDADQQALVWAQANPTDPRAAAILNKLGVR